MFLIDHILFFLIGMRDYVAMMLERHTAWTAFLFFFPLVIFFEMPRYFFPTVLIPLVKMLGLQRNNRKALPGSSAPTRFAAK